MVIMKTKKNVFCSCAESKADLLSDWVSCKTFYGKIFLAQDSGKRDACEWERKDIAFFFLISCFLPFRFTFHDYTKIQYNQKED